MLASEGDLGARSGPPHSLGSKAYTVRVGGMPTTLTYPDRWVALVSATHPEPFTLAIVDRCVHVNFDKEDTFDDGSGRVIADPQQCSVNGCNAIACTEGWQLDTAGNVLPFCGMHGGQGPQMQQVRLKIKRRVFLPDYECFGYLVITNGGPRQRNLVPC